ncbi:MAG: flagellar basal-body rod protein FlgG [Alphaproteobacteria bacterium]|jgi:flagellar basal-body rod protein FlgG|nr:flagellar basal-body rod protein FlgG [Alphaproteobacteria bacterium]MCB1550765.1 flagellar basal-body rod protein FlgG [Alphaproteobacteria bacterium]MCB9984394.1 flagellar basal-body rod protein FlgG [Micavibrio sp.]HRK97840.1 flagellar basal-body rod protein FlgG [Alphaproteobacteria bacterium]
MRSLDIGATGMLAQQMNVDTISNNIANMTTTGFKLQRLEFKDLMYQHLARPGATSSTAGTVVPSGLSLGLGVRPSATYRIHQQGTLQITDGDLDLAINGRGFFQIELPNGDTAYTRAGGFQLNQDGEIVTSEGYRLLPGITASPDTIYLEVNTEGEVLAKLPQQVAMQNLGQIELANFANPSGLEAVGDTMFMETDASGQAIVGAPNSDNLGSIRQGLLEQSNVDSVKEITLLITAQRAYEMNSNVISTSDEMMDTVNQLR